MKILIWFVAIFIASLITTYARDNGIVLGMIPIVILYGGLSFVARLLCAKVDEKKKNKQK